MKSKESKYKYFCLVFLLFLLFLSFPASAQRELEAEYPEAGGTSLDTVATSLPEYVKYIFNFAIWIAGALSLFFLVYGGFLYLTSAGSPQKMQGAKDQIIASLLGMAILGGSYFILYNINPQLTNLKVPGLEKFEIPALEGTISTPAEATPAGRIKEISKKIKELVEDIFKSATSLRQSTGRCDCRYTIPQCDCIGLMCAGIQCYGDPCPERENIEKMQRELVNQIEELLFYKRWIESEREDMAAELQAAEEEGYITQEEISSLLSQIDILMVQIDGTAQAELLDPEKEEMGERTGTAGMKELVEKLLSMPEQCTSGWCAPGCIENAGSEISDSEAKLSYKIASLSYSFLLAQCSGGVCPVPGEEEEEEEEEEEGGEGGGGKEDTGCHDGTGCHPSACDIGDYCPKIFEQFIGSNPCPQNPIIDKVDEIEGLKNKIQETCNKIIAILE